MNKFIGMQDKPVKLYESADGLPVAEDLPVEIETPDIADSPEGAGIVQALLGKPSVPEIDKAPEAPPPPFESKFRSFVDSRRADRLARESAMTPEEKQMRSIQRMQVANTIATPLVSALISAASKGRVPLDMGSRAAAGQAALANQYNTLSTANKEKKTRARFSDAASQLELPEGYESLAPTLKVMAAEYPEDAVKLLTNLAIQSAKPGKQAPMPLTPGEIKELETAPDSEKQYALNEPEKWRRSKMNVNYAGQRFAQGLDQRQYEQGVSENQEKYRRINALADDWSQNAANKAVATVAAAFRQAETVYKQILSDPKYAGSGDQVLITALNKLVDPTSVVREAEYNRTGADLPLYNRWTSEIQRLTKGGRIEPASRARLMDIMREMNDQMLTNASEQQKAIAYRAQAQGLNPEDIFGPQGSWIKPRKRYEFASPQEAMDADANGALETGAAIYINGKYAGKVE